MMGPPPSKRRGAASATARLGLSASSVSALLRLPASAVFGLLGSATASACALLHSSAAAASATAIPRVPAAGFCLSLSAFLGRGSFRHDHQLAGKGSKRAAPKASPPGRKGFGQILIGRMAEAAVNSIAGNRPAREWVRAMLY
jgi:hypothetical protein